MPSAEIITIGTEILLGEIIDTNAAYVAKRLRDVGIDLFRTTTVGDNIQRIAQAIQDAIQRCEIILTTGGLGPTVDDPTRDAIALAMGVETEFQPELWEQIRARFRRFGRLPTENNKRQAYIPKGAIAVENPVGTAPAFIFERAKLSVICIPGVPSEMEYLLENSILPYLRNRYHLSGTIKARNIHTVGIGESQIDDLIGDLETLSNPTVGLAAHSGQVDVRITAKAGSEVEADAMIQQIETEVRRRLGVWVYGADDDTLVGCALKALQTKGWTLTVVEVGVGGYLVRQFAAGKQSGDQSLTSGFLGGEVLTGLSGSMNLRTITDEYRQARQADVGLGVTIISATEKQDVHIVLITPQGQDQFNRPYGGPPEYASRWAVNHCLDLIRRL